METTDLQVIPEKNEVLETYSIESAKKMIELAATLKKFCVENKLISNIQKRDYAQVEAWQFLGACLGVHPEIEFVKNESTYELMNVQKPIKEWINGQLKTVGYNPIQVPLYKYIARCVLLGQNREIISAGESMCTNIEASKIDFDEYSINSMAQTRSIGKAFRNRFAWIMKAAGFEATPAEEMDFAKDENLPPPSPTPTAKNTNPNPKQELANQVKIWSEKFAKAQKPEDFEPFIAEIARMKNEEIKKSIGGLFREALKNRNFYAEKGKVYVQNEALGQSAEGNAMLDLHAKIQKAKQEFDEKIKSCKKLADFNEVYQVYLKQEEAVKVAIKPIIDRVMTDKKLVWDEKAKKVSRNG